jgi:hypothetical protein
MIPALLMSTVRMLRDQPFRHSIDAVAIDDIELERDHARVSCDHRLEMLAPASSDDHLVAEPVEGFGEPTADARSPSGHEHGVAFEFHRCCPRKLSQRVT